MIKASSLLFLFYLLGSLSPAIIISKIFSLQDPRLVGSKNAGTTNMLRNGNKKIALLVLLLDMLKGAVAITIAKYLFPLNTTYILLSALLVTLGHIYPIFFNFHGGKGVATFLGALLAISLISGILFILCWLVIILSTRYSSLASLISVTVGCSSIYYFTHNIIIFVIFILIVIKHKKNIIRLLKKQESKLVLYI